MTEPSHKIGYSLAKPTVLVVIVGGFVPACALFGSVGETIGWAFTGLFAALLVGAAQAHIAHHFFPFPDLWLRLWATSYGMFCGSIVAIALLRATRVQGDRIDLILWGGSCGTAVALWAWAWFPRAKPCPSCGHSDVQIFGSRCARCGYSGASSGGRASPVRTSSAAPAPPVLSCPRCFARSQYDGRVCGNCRYVSAPTSNGAQPGA